MWLLPFRHHWLDAIPRATNAIFFPSGEGAAPNSFAYRSSDTACGVPPSAGTRKTSFIAAMSRLAELK
jgi:hypothetical protein